MAERTLIILKPDCIQRALAGEVISRFENKGFRLAGMKLMHIDRRKAELHYAEHQGKGFYEDMIGFITSSPVVVMALEGDNVIKIAREMAGATKAEDAKPGTIRGDFAVHTNRNIVHSSDSPENAKREITIFFSEEEIFSYARNIDSWI